ncbi:hypothetical protein GCM10011594_43850 [Nakamurella endophytica]|uniref:Uncharacterized protein n=1 Tax=Nakamurella endophytica TaxID=1748367 RepID=A0A917TDS5_9ACTN|nr:hypothetical protein GCM10011594_43850 [Nakamurella endophytica]
MLGAVAPTGAGAADTAVTSGGGAADRAGTTRIAIAAGSTAMAGVAGPPIRRDGLAVGR